MRGHEVLLIEALELVGGKFTHIDCQGFAVPTGAFHALPGGSHGPLYRCLERIGLEVELVELTPYCQVVSENDSQPLELQPSQSGGRLRRVFRVRSRLRLLSRMCGALLGAVLGVDPSLAWVFRNLSIDDYALRVLDHLTKFAMGVSCDQTSFRYLLSSLRAQRYAREGVLRAGNRGLVDSVLTQAVRHGAVLRTKTPIVRIVLRRGCATHVVTADGEEIPAGTIFSNAGAARTALLLGQDCPPSFGHKIRKAVGAYGVAFAVRCRKRLHSHQTVEIPVHLSHIAGILPVSNICPALSPPGWSFSLAYQALDPALPIEPQVEKGVTELRAHLGEDIDIFNIAAYRGCHPAASVAQALGQGGCQRFAPSVYGVQNLFMVGHDMCGYGIAAEIIGYSCLRQWRQFE